MSKILAIGDIHTKTWIIDAVENVLDDYDAVVFVGDYADDWSTGPKDSIDTWNRLKELQEHNIEKVNLVLGNHDYIYVNKTPTFQTGYDRSTQLLINNPENNKLREWLGLLPIWIEIDGVTYSHGGLTVFYEDGHDLWNEDSPLWARPGREDYQDKPQVFGHTPSETCWEVQPNVWCIDTFSTHQDGTPIGDQTVLEIINGKKFNIKKLNEHNNNTSNIKDPVS